MGKTFKQMCKTCPNEVSWLLTFFESTRSLPSYPSLIQQLLFVDASHTTDLVQIASYGACVMAHKDAIEQGVCEKEFRLLQQCFAKSVSVPALFSACCCGCE